jgi:hypothetical protein
MNKKQTAVEWLVEKIQQANPTFKFDALIREAKAMEEEQICDAWRYGFNLWDKDRGGSVEYYNKTFKK